MYVTSIEITNASPASTQEWIGVVRKESLEISVEANGKASTASMEALIDISRDGSGYSVYPQSEIEIRGADSENWIKYSEDLSNAAWVKRGSITITADDTTAPDGTATADKVVDLEGDGGSAKNFYQITALPAGANYSPSFYIKRVSTSGSISINNVYGGIYGQWIVDLAALPDSWVRITRDSPYIFVSYEFVAYPTTGNNSGILIYRQSGASALSFHFWGASITLGSTVWPYAKTTSAAIQPTILFSGYVSRVEPQVIGPDSIRYRISCQDNTRLLDTVVVASESYTSQTDEYILDDLFSTYLSDITTTGVQSVATLDSITFENLTLRQCVERICDRTGAQWRLGFDGDLKYYSITDNDGAFDFSDSANGTTTEFYLQGDFGYQEEFSTPANTVSVVGYQAPRPDPVTTTLSVSASADDGMVGYTNTLGNFPPTTSDTAYSNTNADVMSLQCTGADSLGYSIYTNCLIRFDTSGIPDDAVITSAVLKLTMYRVIRDTAALEFGIQYYASSNWPIGTPGDYSTTPSNGSDSAATMDALDWVFFSSLGISSSATVPSTHSFTLLNPNSNISKTGYTGLRLFAGDAGFATGEENTISIYTVDETRTTWRPTLTITYQQPQQDPVTGSYTDSTSVSLYGTFEKTINDPQATTEAECNARAEVETVRYGYPRKSINCTFDRDGLEVGDTVHFASSLLGIDDDFVVQRLRMKWPGKQSKTRYYAELGEARADLIEYLRKLK